MILGDWSPEKALDLRFRHNPPSLVHEFHTKAPVATRKLVEVREDGCWPWIGARKRGRGPYRRLYSRVIGQPHPDLTLDHFCCNRLCMNPWHLQEVSLPENKRRWAEFLLLPERDRLVADLSHEQIGGSVPLVPI